MFPEIKTQTTKLLKNEDGFTIIEVLMAVIILSLGMMAYGVTSGSIMTRNTHSTKESIAITLAQDSIEELKSKSLGGLGLPYSDSKWINEEGITGPSHNNYFRTTTVNDAGHSCACYYDIKVTVAWNNNGDHAVELNTQVSQ